jgi:hypothetical protein
MAHMLLQRYTVPGATETSVSQRASMEANLAMLDAIGPIYRGQNMFSEGASAGYRGQIGRNSSIPHALANNIVFQAGDVLVTGATAPVRLCPEWERSVVIGKPTDEVKGYFDHGRLRIALAAMGPGNRVRKSIAVRRISSSMIYVILKHLQATALAYIEGRFFVRATTRLCSRGWCSPLSRGCMCRVADSGIRIRWRLRSGIDVMTIIRDLAV